MSELGSLATHHNFSVEQSCDVIFLSFFFLEYFFKFLLQILDGEMPSFIFLFLHLIEIIWTCFVANRVCVRCDCGAIDVSVMFIICVRPSVFIKIIEKV